MNLLDVNQVKSCQAKQSMDGELIALKVSQEDSQNKEYSAETSSHDGDAVDDANNELDNDKRTTNNGLNNDDDYENNGYNQSPRFESNDGVNDDFNDDLSGEIATFEPQSQRKSNGITGLNLDTEFKMKANHHDTVVARRKSFHLVHCAHCNS